MIKNRRKSKKSIKRCNYKTLNWTKQILQINNCRRNKFSSKINFNIKFSYNNNHRKWYLENSMPKIKFKNNVCKIFQSRNIKVKVQKESLLFKSVNLKSAIIELRCQLEIVMTHHNIILKTKKIQKVHI